jgi:tetratricopeptide (TPR) repeat protein
MMMRYGLKNSEPYFAISSANIIGLFWCTGNCFRSACRIKVTSMQRWQIRTAPWPVYEYWSRKESWNMRWCSMRALEIKKKTLGEDHSSVADTYNNMTVVLRSQGKLDDAMELYRKALEIYNKTLWEEARRKSRVDSARKASVARICSRTFDQAWDEAETGRER